MWLLFSSLLATILAIWAAYKKGQKRGEEKQELNHTEKVLENARRADVLQRRFDSDPNIVVRLREFKDKRK